MDGEQPGMEKSERPILLVDDELRILQAHSYALQLAGFRQIVACSDAREVESLVARSAYSVILLDLAMPYITGTELLPIIRRYQPDTPIIVVSAFGDVDAVSGAVESRVYGYLLKPVERKQLVGVVEGALAFGHDAGCDPVVPRLSLAEDRTQERNDEWPLSSREPATLLQRARQEYRLLFQGLPVAAFVFDRATSSLVVANRALRELLGFTGDIADLDLRDMVGQEAERVALANCLGSYDKAEVREADVVLGCPDGRKISVNVRCTTGGEEDKLIHGALLDLAERKRAEPGVHSNMERRTVLRQVHHRVNNNLQVVASLINIQMGHARDTASTHTLASIQSRIATMGAVHHLLYDISDGSDIDMATLAGTVTRNVQERLDMAPAPLSVTVECEPYSVPLRKTVPTALLLAELLCNSLQHAFGSGESGIVTIRGRRTAEGRYRLSVCDTGHGEPPFSGADGLGLVLVAAFEEQINATGTFLRNSPHGTRYILELPPGRSARAADATVRSVRPHDWC